MERAQETQQVFYFCFIDYSKAFDCVDHEVLWSTLKTLGVSSHLADLVRSLYLNQEAVVRTEHEETAAFGIGKGVRQVCILSPLSFNVYVEMVMRDVLEDCYGGVWIVARMISNLRYADDTSREQKWVKDVSAKVGQHFMTTARVNSHIVLDDEVMEAVDSFVFIQYRRIAVRRSREDLARAGHRWDAWLRSWKTEVSAPKRKSCCRTRSYFQLLCTVQRHEWSKERSANKQYFEIWCWRPLLRVPWTAKRTTPGTWRHVKHLSHSKRELQGKITFLLWTRVSRRRILAEGPPVLEYERTTWKRYSVRMSSLTWSEPPYSRHDKELEDLVATRGRHRLGGTSCSRCVTSGPSFQLERETAKSTASFHFTRRNRCQLYKKYRDTILDCTRSISVRNSFKIRQFLMISQHKIHYNNCEVVGVGK